MSRRCTTPAVTSIESHRPMLDEIERRGRRVYFPPETATGQEGDVALGDELTAALLELTEQQRTAVLLVHAYGWTPKELAGIIGSRPATVRSHLRRGLRQLRKILTEGNGS